jgi:hypothetical protein
MIDNGLNTQYEFDGNVGDNLPPVIALLKRQEEFFCLRNCQEIALLLPHGQMGDFCSWSRPLIRSKAQYATNNKQLFKGIKICQIQN